MGEEGRPVDRPGGRELPRPRGEVELRGGAHAEALGVVGQPRRSDREPDLSEVDVLGEPEAVGHVEVPVSVRSRAHEVIAPGFVRLIRIVHPELLVRIEAALERGGRGHHLERRTWRVEPLRRAVDERT